MRRIRGKVIAVCTVIAVILSAKAALTAEIPVVYAVEGSDIDDTAVLEEDGEDERDTELPASGDGADNSSADGTDGDETDGADKSDRDSTDGDTDKAGGDVNSGTDSAADSQTDGGNKTDSKTDADTDDAKADSDEDVKTEDDTLADAEEEMEETLPPAEIRSVFSLRSSRSTGADIGSFVTIDDLNNTLATCEGTVVATLSGGDDGSLIESSDPISVPAAVDLTLKMNGCSLSGFKSNAINVTGGTLTLTGTGSIECNNGYGIMIVDGSVTLEGNQTITSKSDNGIYVAQGGTLTISGGTVKGGTNGIFSAESIVTINSGKITGSTAACYISGGDSVSGTPLTINGGTFNASNGQSLYYAASKKATINGGTFTNGVGVELSKSSESIDSLSIGEWATRFYTKINGSFDNNTFRAKETDSGYYYYIESSTGGKSGTWDGKYKEYRLLEPGKKYSFKDAGCKVSGDDSVYKACDFYFSGEDYYTFTKE